MASNSKSLYDRYCDITRVINEILSVICVLSLAAEFFSVIIMVVGRYVFNSVPLWTERLSVIALVWMSIVSISIGLYHDEHMRVEIFDNVFPPKFVEFLKYLSNIIIIIFSVLMIKYGVTLVNLTKKVLLSGFPVSTAFMYIPLVICGVSSIYMSIFCMVRRYKEGKA